MPVSETAAPSPVESIAFASEQPIYSLGQLVGYMLKLGTVGFGGSVALVGYMHRDLVERRQWFFITTGK